ncbi:acyltransferase family protein [Sphingomonas sp. MMS24-J45]|uniref:acyltransferase family protein n=1 Tax=Sphingomonas sp. MMS24-J45 TaxID=3238806 RepID=UPI00384A723A
MTNLITTIEALATKTAETAVLEGGPERGRSGYVFGLDVVRACAVSLVVLAHLQIRADILGVGGVELFFVLSGFLVGGIFLRAIVADPGAGAPLLLHFWQRRWARTLPNYFLFFAVYAAVFHDELPPLAQLWKYALFLQNLTKPIPFFYGLSWSLSVEEWFYLIVPGVTMLGLKILRRPIPSILATIAALIVGSFVVRLLAHPSDWNTGMRMVVIYRLDALAIGVACAVVAQLLPDTWRRFGRLWPVGFVLLMVLSLSLWRHTADLTALQAALLFTALPLCCALLVAGAVRLPDGGGRVRGAIKHLSQWSYSIYLAHAPVLFLLYRVPGYEHFPPIARLGVRGVAVVLTLVVSASVYSFFEQPMLRLLSPKRAPH